MHPGELLGSIEYTKVAQPLFKGIILLSVTHTHTHTHTQIHTHKHTHTRMTCEHLFGV